ncbi:hypothetical protein BDR05DRAFT_975792 [Suillus weaverae]|nr:hypothetical protein BDR05DRAFT_975792 [Suillus weaverae]
MAPNHTRFCDLCSQDIKPQGWTTHRKACETNTEKQRHDQVTVDMIQQEKAPPTYLLDDIKVKHHPNSGIEAKVYPFNNFHFDTSPDYYPWCPFQSQLDCEVAELALKVRLNNEQMDCLIKICHHSSLGKDKCMFRNHKDIHGRWEAASHRITKFTKDVISVPYDSEMRDFDVYYRDLWELTTDLLRDPCLFPHFVFNAQCLSKFDGQTFVRFVDEPFTMQDFWNVQLQLPPDAKPLAFILYADKTRLLSFGTVKGYPVVACLANLPTDIRNGQGIGSGYIVGWLPIVTEDKEHAGKSSWVNFKNTVWHYLWPCPICLVPRDELWDTSKWYPHQIADRSWNIVLAAWEKDTYKELEELLKQYGLYVHRALSHDRCHYNHGGLWSCHYWVELQKCLMSLRRTKHPNQIMSVAFADSSVHEDISKMIIYATHNILTEEASPLGYFLLHCVHLYLEVDMYADFEVHTVNMINEGRSAVQALPAFMKQYITATDEEDDKNWNFPKLHTTMHLFNDIEAKGVTRNYNMKPNEQMHGPLKDSLLFHLPTNGASKLQILRINHWLLISDDIPNNIDDDADEDDPDSDLLTDPIMHDFNPLDGSMHVNFGSREALQSFGLVENSHKDDNTFTNFHVKLNSFLNVFLPASNIPLPDGKRVHLLSNYTITTCQLLHVNYESMVDWRQHTDYLQCNPQFFNAPCFDCVFIQTKQKVILGRLLLLFECPVGNNVYPLALIHPYDAPTGARLQKYKHLNLFRAEFFSIRSIIRGALLVHNENLDYFIVDMVDMDMFLRVKEMHLQAGHVVCI